MSVTEALRVALERHQAGDLPQADAIYREILRVEPSHPDALHFLGVIAYQAGKHETAVELISKAINVTPVDSMYLNLGTALRDQGRLDAAIESYHKALVINPDYAEAHYNLGLALQQQGQIEAAIECYRKALAIKADFAEAYCDLGNALQDLAQLDAAVASYRRALQIDPEFAKAHSNLLFCLSHSATVDTEMLFAEHCRFATQFEAPLRAHWPQHTNTRNPDRCLQIGFVSGDLRNHPVAHFIEPVLAHLVGQPKISLHAYYNHPVEDSASQRLRGYLAHWHPIAGLSDEALAQEIHQNGIDILIDLSGHTAGNRLLTFARKPAPIQITWIGYPNTTGLRAMDYVLKDRFNAPYGAYEHYYVEKLARLPSAGTFLPVKGAPLVNDLPALSTGRVTFGSFNRSSKLGDSVIALWSQVLLAVPGSRLLLGNVGEGSLRASLMERFAGCGVTADRLTFQPRMAMNAYLASHHQVDFILDTFPYKGGTTTQHALWMGVPVLTLTGPSPMQHAGALGRVGLTDWIADNAADFVQRAVDWSGRLNELAGLRAGMRERLLSSPLRQPETVARGLAAALTVMWRRWCAGLPAESFEVTLEDLGIDLHVGVAVHSNPTMSLNEVGFE